MANPTLAELAKRVEALEADNARLRLLGQPGAGAGTELAGTEQPTRDAYEVRSELTAALIGRHDEQGTATDEADRLNAECRRDGIRHLGEPMRYEVVKVRIIDEDAAREQRITDLKARIDTTENGEYRDALIAELEAAESEVTDGE